MELDPNLIFNFASIIATLLFTSTAVFTIFRRLRLRWPFKVNCWFCNNYTKIYRTELDWWKCPSCEQYNGFTKDGDYAYDIPEQSTHVPKNFAKPRSKLKKTINRNFENNLCERCNRNEELKISELRTFEPKGFFDNGLDNFKRRLETKYPLCDDCKILVQKVLQKQSMWLTRYKMLFYKQKSITGIINRNAETLDKILRIFLTMLTSTFVLYQNYRQLLFLGALLQSSAFLINQARRSLDAILTLLWICIIFLDSIWKINFSDLYDRSEYPFLENFTGHQFATILTVIIGLLNIIARYKNTRSFKASFKKLESVNGKKDFYSNLSNSFKDFDSSETITESQTYSNYHVSSTDHPKTKSQKNSSPTLTKCEDQQLDLSATLRKNVSSNYPDTGSRHILKFDGNSEQYTLNDSLSTLKTLSLGESRIGQASKIPSIFKTKVYGSTSPDLFHRTKKSTRKFILAPPKLKSFAQTSWVAGGYWQVGVDSPSLSRSSSQSSGFGSAGSNFGPSREPSVTKEVDKCSVISDNTQLCYAPRPNSPNSVNSCCQHVQFSRCDNNLYNQSLKILPNSMQFLQNSQSHFSPVHPESNFFYEPCLSLQNRNLNSNFQTSQRLSNFSNAFNNSAVWLTILLGGSLVFNIVVFCTIILR